ncbi:MAG: Hsp20/alpha crystallin family protein [Crocinitomicaceae bacterium]|nr:Hsp20/alpha crystallin family protein [Crocinitomicaceae bacterium]
MTIIKRNQGLFPSMFHNFFENEWRNNTGLSTSFANQPSVNIKETEEHFLIEMATPGIRKEDINIQVENGILEVSAMTKGEQVNSENEEKYTRREFYSTSFRQTFTLSEAIDDTHIGAKYEDGVLSIVLPKSDIAKPKPVQQIKIA